MGVTIAFVEIYTIYNLNITRNFTLYALICLALHLAFFVKFSTAALYIFDSSSDEFYLLVLV